MSGIPRGKSHRLAAVGFSLLVALVVLALWRHGLGSSPETAGNAKDEYTRASGGKEGASDTRLARQQQDDGPTSERKDDKRVAKGNLTCIYHIPRRFECAEAEVIVVDESGLEEQNKRASPGSECTFTSIRHGRKTVVVIPPIDSGVAPSFGTTEVLKDKNARLEVYLKPGFRVSGVVLRSNGDPLPGADVSAEMVLRYPVKPQDDGLIRMSGHTRSDSHGMRNAWAFFPADGILTRSVRTDRNGRFELDGFGSAPLQLRIRYEREKVYEHWVVPGMDIRIVVPD